MRDYYDRYWSDEGFRPRGTVSRHLEPYLDALPPGALCVDIGCGDGRGVGTWLLAHGRGFVGVDVSETAVSEARSLGLDARRIDDIAHLPFEPASFDAAICTEVLEHVFSPLDGMREVHRVLKPGGTLLLTVPNIAYWRWRLDFALLGRWNPHGDPLAVAEPWRDPHIRFFTRPSLRRMLGTAGFREIRVSAHGGQMVRHLPWVKRVLPPSDRASAVYRLAETALPALLGYRLYGQARK